MPDDHLHRKRQTYHQLRREVTAGLLYDHSRLNTNTVKTLETASFLYALIELMSEKGLIGIDELDARKRIVGEPYLIEHSTDGYCIHLDQETSGCTIYADRPVPCRN
jgi:Fe-S-cluster containining protein